MIARHRFYVTPLYSLLVTASLSSFANAQKIVAHRGASHEAPENTLVAFKLAFEQGADGVEGDYYLSSDGKIVCIHDADTERTAGVKHVVKETSFDELRKLDVGSWKNEKYRGERMPTLEEVIDLIPDGKMIVIELKTGPEIVTPLRKALEASDLKDEQILIIAFDEKAITECERQMPQLRTHWLTGYKKSDETGEWLPTREQVDATLDRSHADGLGTQAEPNQVDAEFLEGLCDEGHCEFHVWTVDNAKIAGFYRDHGAWGITTNRPGWLRKQLEAAPEPEPEVEAR